MCALSRVTLVADVVREFVPMAWHIASLIALDRKIWKELPI